MLATKPLKGCEEVIVPSRVLEECAKRGADAAGGKWSTSRLVIVRLGPTYRRRSQWVTRCWLRHSGKLTNQATGNRRLCPNGMANESTVH